jgi:hypothetical protein
VNEEQLQELLSVYRYERPMPALRNGSRWWIVPLAAALIIAIVGVWASSWHAGWRVLRAGESISTATRIRKAGIGYVDIAEGTVVRVEARNRLTLERGTIHAKTISPPGIFIVDTPRARAIDLGCEYTLSISPAGGGVLRVSAGWVSLNNWQQSLVPQGASARIETNGNLGPPVFDDASAEFKRALAAGNLTVALGLARRRDALTLINLFRNASEQQRVQVFNRLNELVPAPLGVTPYSIEPWWPLVIKASGVNAIKKKYPRGGNAQDQTYLPSW